MIIDHLSMEHIMRIVRTSTPVLVAFVFALAGCGGGDADDAAAGGAPADAAPAVDPSQAAVVHGTVNFTGSAPAPDPIDMSEEQACASTHADGPHTERVVVNGNGTLRNVFIHVREGLPQQNWPSSGETPVLDQEGCIYQPHVLGVRTGQEFIIRNSDPVLHNVNASPSQNRTFNIGQPRAGMETRRSFSQSEIMIPVTCQVHGWMESYIGVVDHPYFAVTGEDGTYRLENLPPGTYTIEAWHEQYGTQTQTVTVAAQQTGEADFTFDGSRAAHVPLGRPFDPHDHAVAVAPVAHGSR